MTDPDPAHMLHYCSTVVPDVLTTVCGVDADLAHRIGVDILDRAEAFAARYLFDRPHRGLLGRSVRYDLSPLSFA